MILVEIVQLIVKVNWCGNGFIDLEGNCAGDWEPHGGAVGLVVVPVTNFLYFIAHQEQNYTQC